MKILDTYNIPVVSIEHFLAGCYNVNFQYKNSMKKIVEHLVEKHGFTRELYERIDNWEHFQRGQIALGADLTDNDFFQGKFDKALVHVFPSEFTCARFGGDEFIKVADERMYEDKVRYHSRNR